MKPEVIEENKSLREMNWWRVGGVARYYAAPRSLEELKNVWRWAANPSVSGLAQALPIWVFSGGSNILVQEGVVQGLVLSMHELRGLEVLNTTPNIEVRCWAGTAKSEVAKIFLQNRLPPAVFLTGIPGDMGGGVVMNAGIGEARVPREFCEIVREVEVLNYDPSRDQFNVRTFKGADLCWEYRHSSGWQPGIITQVTVGWVNSPDAEVPNLVRAQTQKRVSTQPLNIPNCGSVFRNPIGHKSAQLIEGCGLKGFRVGGACVSTKHANFIVNDNGATANDVDQVIRHVRSTVFEKTGVELQAEVVYIGAWSR
jgi:UDP-N-acetylmuramate dehydrogenase